LQFQASVNYQNILSLIPASIIEFPHPDIKSSQWIFTLTLYLNRSSHLIMKSLKTATIFVFLKFKINILFVIIILLIISTIRIKHILKFCY
jgi:hypothetical protein